ncbi:MAG: hypothetical protein MUF61_02015 [archaeon]|jgi:hypothetical protein|nr:hypothetical protein [archaeon]
MGIDITPTMDVGTIIALGAAAVFISLVVVLAVYIFTSIALMVIANKTKTKNSWLAWIPIANFYLVTQIAKVSGLWTLMLLALCIPTIGPLAVAITAVWMFWRISERRGFPGWLSILLLVPVVNLVVLGIIAWAK